MLCEGGGRLAAALIEDDLVDEVVSYTAGLVLGSEAIPAVGPLEVAALQLAPRFRLVDVAAVGPDVRSRWRAAAETPARPGLTSMREPRLPARLGARQAAIRIIHSLKRSLGHVINLRLSDALLRARLREAIRYQE